MSVKTSLQILNRFLAEGARDYNEPITSWTGIESAAVKVTALKQGELFYGMRDEPVHPSKTL